MSQIKILRVKPEQAPETITIEDTLRSLQSEVGGCIQAVYPFDDPVAIICNEEGKLDNLPYNRALRDEQGNIYDIIAGTFLIAGITGDSFDSLSPDLLTKYEAYYHTPEQFVLFNGQITALPLS